MVEPGKFTDRASEIANHLLAAAGPLKERAEELAGAAAEAAGPLKDRADELVARAGELAAQGAGVIADGLDKVTGGKLSDQISTVTSKVQDVLDPEEKKL